MSVVQVAKYCYAVWRVAGKTSACIDMVPRPLLTLLPVDCGRLLKEAHNLQVAVSNMKTWATFFILWLAAAAHADMSGSNPQSTNADLDSELGSLFGNESEYPVLNLPFSECIASCMCIHPFAAAPLETCRLNSSHTSALSPCVQLTSRFAAHGSNINLMGVQIRPFLDFAVAVLEDAVSAHVTVAIMVGAECAATHPGCR